MAESAISITELQNNYLAHQNLFMIACFPCHIFVFCCVGKENVQKSFLLCVPVYMWDSPHSLKGNVAYIKKLYVRGFMLTYIQNIRQETLRYNVE